MSVRYWTDAGEVWELWWPSYARLPKLMEEACQLTCSEVETVVYLWPLLFPLSAFVLVLLGLI